MTTIVLIILVVENFSTWKKQQTNTSESVKENFCSTSQYVFIKGIHWTLSVRGTSGRNIDLEVSWKVDCKVPWSFGRLAIYAHRVGDKEKVIDYMQLNKENDDQVSWPMRAPTNERETFKAIIRYSDLREFPTQHVAEYLCSEVLQMRRRAIADRFEINRIKRQAIVDRKADRFEMSRREQIHIEQIHEMRVMQNKFWVALAVLFAIVLSLLSYVVLLSERIYASL